MKLRSYIFLLSNLVSIASGHAQISLASNDQMDCDGRAMSERSCQFIREREEHSNRIRKELLQEQAAREKFKAEAAERMARRAEQDKYQFAQEQDEQKKALAASLKWQADEEAKRKKLCGGDFGKLRIGMTLDRYEECTEAVDYVTERVSNAGKVEVYRGMFYYIEAREGKIVAFTRR